MRLEGMISTEYGSRLEKVEAPTYEAARTAVEAKVGEGEQLLSIRRLDD